jgi:amino acid transporter
MNLAISGIAAAVHFLAFLLVGLPLFFQFYPRPESRLWHWLPGMMLGLVIGCVSVLCVLYQRPLTCALGQSIFAGSMCTIAHLFAGILGLSFCLTALKKQLITPLLMFRIYKLNWKGDGL